MLYSLNPETWILHIKLNESSSNTLNPRDPYGLGLRHCNYCLSRQALMHVGDYSIGPE